MENTVTIGQSAEDMAVHYLSKQGFQIKERNWRFGKAEIDIIAIHQEEMVFVEVKFRASDKFQAPWMSIQQSKKNRIIKAANHYLKKIQWEGEARFDVVSIVGNFRNAQIQHFPNAFYPVV